MNVLHSQSQSCGVEARHFDPRLKSVVTQETGIKFLKICQNLPSYPQDAPTGTIRSEEIEMRRIESGAMRDYEGREMELKQEVPAARKG
jgi:hypothetical protein